MGEYKNDLKHGRGVYTWLDGRKYTGHYQNDCKHGYGEFEWANGRRFEGHWAYGKQHGFGRYYEPRKEEVKQLEYDFDSD